jgi:UDP-N-acetylmuramate: L-alanyl-gamma-D-glutamyl-meso-diaminopimelate ligase
VFQDDFAQAFAGADAVVVAAAHMPGKVPESQRLSENDLVQAMKARGQDARFIGPVDDIVTHLARELREGDRVVVLSNGGFGGIHGKLLAALGAPAAVPR